MIEKIKCTYCDAIFDLRISNSNRNSYYGYKWQWAN